MTDPTETRPIQPSVDTAPTEPMAPTQPAGDTATAQAVAPQSLPRLAEGVELLGRFEDSGYKEPPFIARRGDGQMIQLPLLLYAVAESADGQRGYEDIGHRLQEQIGRGLPPEDVEMLVDQKLRPLGVLAGPDGSSPQVEKGDPFLALKLRTAMVPERAVRAIATLFRPFFWPPVIIAILAGLVAFDIWFFFSHGVAQSMRELLYQPLYMIMTFAFIVLSAALHELGHAAACKYGGAEPGVMGAGIYIVWPAFYTDVTDAYRLSKGGRLRTDLGGVFFNAVFILSMAGIYFATGFEPLLIPIFVSHLEVLRQLLPLLRLDGYYILADLTGVPDLFARIKPILVSMVPGKKSDKRVTELKPWVRGVVTLWVLVFVPFLAFNVALILTHAPRIFATGWDSFLQKFDTTQTAFGDGQALSGTAGVLQMVTLALPALGIAYSFGRTIIRTSGGLWKRTDGKPLARSGSLLLIVGGLAGLAYLWWPDGDYKPIQPGERWTVQEAVVNFSETAQGEPAFAEVPADITEDETRDDSNTDPVTDQEPDVEASVTPDRIEDEASPEPTSEPTSEPSPDVTAEPSPEPTVTSSP